MLFHVPKAAEASSNEAYKRIPYFLATWLQINFIKLTILLSFFDSCVSYFQYQKTVGLCG